MDTLARRIAAHSIQSESGCLLWNGATKGQGYGAIRARRGTMRVHRVAWELAHGPIPPGLSVCHRCDVKLCLNVEHLFLGTHAENMADMVKKGRLSSRVPHNRVIMESDARMLRELKNLGWSTLALVAELGLSKPTIDRWSRS